MPGARLCHLDITRPEGTTETAEIETAAEQRLLLTLRLARVLLHHLHCLITERSIDCLPLEPQNPTSAHPGENMA